MCRERESVPMHKSPRWLQSDGARSSWRWRLQYISQRPLRSFNCMLELSLKINSVWRCVCMCLFFKIRGTFEEHDTATITAHFRCSIVPIQRTLPGRDHLVRIQGCNVGVLEVVGTEGLFQSGCGNGSRCWYPQHPTSLHTSSIV